MDWRGSHTDATCSVIMKREIVLQLVQKTSNTWMSRKWVMCWRFAKMVVVKKRVACRELREEALVLIRVEDLAEHVI